MLYENPADVALPPQLEHCEHKFAKLPGQHTAVGHALNTGTLNNGYKLKVLGAHGFDSLINLFRMIAIVTLHHSQYVRVHILHNKMFKPSLDLIKRAVTTLGDAVAVVQDFGTIDAGADEKFVGAQKLAP